MSGFQTQVNTVQAPAVAGDFASTNPRGSVLAGPGGLISGSAGVYTGRFAWVNESDLSTVTNSGFGRVPDGFVHRAQQATITNLLSEASQLILAGQAMGLMAFGDFWVKNDGSTTALRGQRCYANYTDGKAQFAAAGGALTASATGSIAAGTGSATGTITGNLMTLTASLAGGFHAGAPVTGAGVITGTKIVRQLSGTANGLGTYEVTPGEQTVTSTTISETHGVFTAASVLVGTFVIGGVLSGSGVTTNTTITEYGTGDGGLGTYIVDTTQTAGSTTITETVNVDTLYVAETYALPGELVKISGPKAF